jgi:hypothetical protein
MENENAPIPHDEDPDMVEMWMAMNLVLAHHKVLDVVPTNQ